MEPETQEENIPGLSSDEEVNEFRAQNSPVAKNQPNSFSFSI